MTEMNPLPNEEEVAVNDTTQPGRDLSTQEKIIRRAVLVGQNVALNTILFGGLGVYLAIQTGAWQAYALAILGAMAVMTGFLGVISFKI